ncbi:MAG: NADH-quinone oxidoreductase subunit C [Actinobacteria bacterium]|nr:NADH-quinone oxidoreductase subunit C [Actinomycetota bacterium]
MSDAAIDTPAPAGQMYGCDVTYSRGEKVIHVSRANYIATLKKAERFEIVLNLISLERRERLRLRIQIAEGEASLPTAFDLYPGTEAMEREVFDMFGIQFEGHPDPSRILMPEDWEGHPLRKDFSVGRIPVQFKGAPS